MGEDYRKVIRPRGGDHWGPSRKLTTTLIVLLMIIFVCIITAKVEIQFGGSIFHLFVFYIIGVTKYIIHVS